MTTASTNAACNGMPQPPSYFLIKSNPTVLSINALEQVKTNLFDHGSNLYRVVSTMGDNDRAWFFHSKCEEPAIVGTVCIKGWTEMKHIQIHWQHTYPVEMKLSELRAQVAAARKRSRELKKTGGTASDDDQALFRLGAILRKMKLLRHSFSVVQHVTAEQWNAVEELIARKASGEQLPTMIRRVKKRPGRRKRRKSGASKQQVVPSSTNDGGDHNNKENTDNNGGDAVAQSKKRKAKSFKAPTPGTRKSKRIKTSDV